MLIVFLGPPGAGKGTQAVRLASHLQVPHLSTGDMLRQAIAAGSPAGHEADAYLRQGKLAPDELVVDMVMSCLTSRACRVGAVLDGFPRTLVQAESLDGELHRQEMRLDGVLQLEVPVEELQQRLLGRGRADDSPATIARRLRVYHEETEPLIDYYGGRDQLRSIDGMGSTDEVFKRIEAAVAALAAANGRS